MGKKIPGEIREIALSDATYAGTGVKIQPTFVNFFFGNNGVGKSTIARAIKDFSGVSFAAGKKSMDYVPLVYNQEFIDANFQNYRNMRGVFTVNEKNAEVQKKVDEKNTELDLLKIDQDKSKSDLAQKKGRRETLKKDFHKECWDRMENYRKDFPKSMDKRGVSRTFTEAITASQQNEADLGDLKRFYNSAFSNTAKPYDEFTEIQDTKCLDRIMDKELLKLHIVNSSNTPFAEFLQNIGATEWVRQGHSEYAHKTNGKCPYCYRQLDDDFEEMMKRSFDTQYTDNLQKLKNLLGAYKHEANTVYPTLQKIPSEIYPQISVTAYTKKLEEIKKTIQLNIDAIQKKIDDPSISVEVEPVEPLLEELSEIIKGFNKLIKANNDILKAGPKKQKECTDMLFAHMAYELRDVIAAYDKSDRDLQSEIKDLEGKIKSSDTKLCDLKKEISSLNSQTVETETAMNSINTMLRDAGFQGFSLKPHETQKHVYKVVRPNGDIAENLSEGEKNFIAFLFFYHLVKGSESADGESRDKIVVIDDPVSSMDSTSLFIVSSIVREMIEVCRNNADNRNMTATGKHIKQIFILTHNAYFHREITYNYVSKYEYVSFYLIRKQNNQSSIRLCECTNPNEPSEKMNVNPVKNSYAALWDEYKEVKSGVPLMNVIHQILEYYFVQLCGYPGTHLRDTILNKKNFQNPDGSEDTERYQLAEAMLSYISASTIGMSDGLHFVDDCVDPDECRKMFENIFRWMNQGQHYDKMMEKY
ncbi:MULTISPECIES: AAA family ATPase [unclassified Blautia]|uniref:AAA family ATPase n=1 Tax=unclassified Blautia TaxID=2648079 RepID=UPI003F8CB513